MTRSDMLRILKGQPVLAGIVGLIIALALAFCFLRVASLAFHAVSFLFWIALGIVAVAVIYSVVKGRLSRKR